MTERLMSNGDMRARPRGSLGALFPFVLTGAVASAAYAASSPPDKTYIVEWVYKVKWGHSDEFFDIFKKYQIPILDREKELGNVLHYTVYRPGLHTSEDERWDYRVVIVSKNQLVPAQAREIEKQLFPDRTAFTREGKH